MINKNIDKKQLEFLRSQAKNKFAYVKYDWCDLLRWAAPDRASWIMALNPGVRRNQHIVDKTHILGLRSYQAGFLEGNTSVSRPWFRHKTDDEEVNLRPENKQWLHAVSRRALEHLASRSNYYHAAATFYRDYGVVNTGVHLVDELDNGRLHFHTLLPGSYYILDNVRGEAIVLIREFRLTVKALVEEYGKKKNGMPDWSNFSSHVRKMYEDGNYTQLIDVVHVIQENSDFDTREPVAGLNKRWISITYEAAVNTQYMGEGHENIAVGPEDEHRFLRVKASKRKPFIVGKSTISFEYGEQGPTYDSLGLIKSLNKKVIAQDEMLEHMVRPPLQGPANLKKSYISSRPNTFVPLDANSAMQKGLRTIFEINPAAATLVQNLGDLRQQVSKLYYEDYLMFLSLNPKTRTATEADGVKKEQQLIIGPNLQSLNQTYNTEVVDYITDYVLTEDPNLPPPPPDLQGVFIKPEFISIFAQAQRAADMPNIERYMASIANVASLDPSIWDKVDVDKYADLLDDRLYLPAGLNRADSQVEAIREQQRVQQERAAALQQMETASKAARNVGMKVNQGETK